MGLGSASSAFAGAPLDEAQAKRSKAFNDFYNSYKASKHTPEDANALSDQTIAPAARATSQAMALERSQALKNLGIQVMSPAQAAAAHERAKKQAEEEAENGGAEAEGKTADGKPSEKTPADATASAAATGTLVGPISRKPAAPEAVIDGTKIPNQITFGDKK
jgi:hypothetical protein